MSKVAVVYWSSTGNTEAMANAVVDGAKEKGADECARIYANKAKHRAGEDFEQSKTVLNNVIQKMANSGMKSAPDSIEAMLWAEAMNKYTSWAERIKLKIKNMGY